MNADNSNQNNSNYSQNTRPYKASGNLNTTIGNPNININNAMDVNIKTMTSNNDLQKANTNYQAEMVNNASINNGNMAIGSSASPDNGMVNKAYSDSSLNVSQNKQTVTRTYVTSDNRPKKRTINFNIGPEFKLVLLIIVILLIFIFILPMITNIF